MKSLRTLFRFIFDSPGRLLFHKLNISILSQCLHPVAQLESDEEKREADTYRDDDDKRSVELSIATCVVFDGPNLKAKID